MMPLTFINPGEKTSIKKIGGKDEAKRHLNTLGFTEGGTVEVVTKNAGNVIVNIKNSRIAISKEMANRIVVDYID